VKRLWICAGILLFLLAATTVNTWAIDRITEELGATLAQAEALAESGDWAQAEALTRRALGRWEDSSGYLYIVLRHSDTDEVNTGFREVLEFINCQEGGEYSAANAELIARIELLADMEQFNLKNLL